jgi:gliding motility-associated-like protein
MKALHIIIVFVFTGMIQMGIASDGGAKRKYRVKAFKSGGANLNSLSNEAEAAGPSTLYIPSAFTPNGDGLNDSFGAKSENIERFKMQIYNRWGELMFESDDIEQWWDGTFRGEKIKTTEVFVYQVKALGKNDKSLIEEKGTVTLIAEGLSD